MTPWLDEKKRLFVLHDFNVMRPLIWLFPPLHRKANKVLQGGVSLPFIGSLRV